MILIAKNVIDETKFEKLIVEDTVSTHKSIESIHEM